MTKRLPEPIARLLVLMIALAMAAVRIPMLAVMHRPGIAWDEFTYLNFARYFAGAGPPIDLRVDPNVEHAGYGLVIAPAFVTHAPFEIAYHLALGINLLLGVCLTLLAYRIARRIVGTSRTFAILCAVALTAYPAFFILPLFVFSENVVFPLTLLCVLAFYEIAENSKRIGWHIAFVLSLVAMWFAHAPTAIVIAVALAGLLCLILTRRMSYLYAGVDAAAALIGFAIVQRVHHHFWPLSWGPTSDSTLVPKVLAGISGHWILDSLHAFFYQQAAIVLPSLGLYVLALGMLIREVVLARKTGWSAAALACAFALAATLGTATLGAAFLATFPGILTMPDALFASRYAEQGVVAVLAIGLPLLFTIEVRLRPYAYSAVGAILLTALLAAPEYNGGTYLQPSESISELAWSGFASLLHGAPMFAIALFALAGLGVVAWSRENRPIAGLLAVSVVWLAFGASEVKRQIAPEQVNYDHLVGATTSKLAPYIRVMPQYPEIPVAMPTLNIPTYNLLALAVPDHRFTLASWLPGTAPAQDVAVAGKAAAPRGFTEIVCEEFPPAACLYVRDPTTAKYLLALREFDAFANHPMLTLGNGIEIGVDHDGQVAWKGVLEIEKTPDGIPFRWTNGNARIVLPPLTAPAAIANINIVAPDAGHITIEVQRPRKPLLKIVDGPDIANGNGYNIPLDPYVPGTIVSIRTTNIVAASDPRSKLSVEIRSFRLFPRP